MICLALLASCSNGGTRARSQDGGITHDAPAGPCVGVTCASTSTDGASDQEGPGTRDAPTVADTTVPDTALEAPAPEAANETASESAPSGCGGVFCEDFESGALDPTKWSATSGANHVDDATPPSVVETDLVAHGKYAAHFQGKGDVPNDDAFIVTKDLPAALLTHNFGRLYFYITPKPQSGHMMMVLGGSTGGSAAMKLKDFEVANINGGWQLGFDQLDVAPMGEEVFYPTGQIPVGKWTCLEWEFDDAPDTDTLWIDGQSLGTLDDEHINYPAGHVPGSPIFNGKSSGLIGGFKAFSFGFFDWHPKNDFDLYYDDIVIDTARVGCL